MLDAQQRVSHSTEAPTAARLPDGHAVPATERSRRKWQRIIGAFMNGRTEDLLRVQRTGARGRILAVLVEAALKSLGMDPQPEPVFHHVAPDPWYVAFSARHGLKLTTLSAYNPDFVLGDGTWVETTLSENTAYRKLFQFGHQAPRLRVIWLDEDTGLHREVCKDVVFPNAQVAHVGGLCSHLRNEPGGRELIDKLQRLRQLRGVLL